MNKLILIGNGFDLSHAIKTSYVDYANYICSNAIDKYIEHKSYRDDIIEIHERHNIRRHYQPVWSHQGLEGRYRLAELQKDPTYITVKIKNNLFKELLDDIEHKNWCDIEQLYFDRLMSCDANDIDRLQDDFENIRKTLIQYLRFCTTQNYTSKYLDILTEPCYQDDLNTQMNDFLICSFNYTDTIQHYYKKLLETKNVQLIYMHGDLQKKYGDPILGYGCKDTDYKMLASTKGEKYLHYMKSCLYSDEDNYQVLKKFLDDSDYEVLIIGMSLGLTDQNLLREIFNHRNNQYIKIAQYINKDGNSDFNSKVIKLGSLIKNIDNVRAKVVPKKYCPVIPNKISK